MDEQDLNDVKEALQGQSEINRDFHHTIAAMQFAQLALAAGAENPKKMVAALEYVKARVLPEEKYANSELRKEVLEHLDLLIEHVNDRAAAGDNQKP